MSNYRYVDGWTAVELKWNHSGLSTLETIQIFNKSIDWCTDHFGKEHEYWLQDGHCKRWTYDQTSRLLFFKDPQDAIMFKLSL